MKTNTKAKKPAKKANTNWQQEFLDDFLANVKPNPYTPEYLGDKSASHTIVRLMNRIAFLEKQIKELKKK